MTRQPQGRNAEIIKAFIAGNTNKAELARYFGVSSSTIRRVLSGVVIAASIMTVTPSANAGLQGLELDAANQYFAAHPDIPDYMQQNILNDNSLAEANNQLTGNDYVDHNGHHVTPEQIPLLGTLIKGTSPDPQTNINSQAIANNHHLLENVTTQLSTEEHQIVNNTQRIDDLVAQPKPQDGVDGKDGAAGANGRDGIDGKDGATGANGHDGIDGKDGAAGANGRDGIDGKDGAAGANGHDGIDGKDGATGANGHDGIDGKDGATGANGHDGIDGKDGAAGANGHDGIDGKDGAAGANGHDGIDGKDGATGTNGQDGINGTDGKDADMTQVKKAEETAKIALFSADKATTKATEAQQTAEGTAKQQAIVSGDRYQSMLHARAHSEMTAEVAAHEKQTQQQLKATKAKTQQSVEQQQRRANYYDQQITALNNQAQENHAEVLSESHARAAGDQQTLQQSQNYTNQKFSDLKSQVDDNKKQANAGIAGVAAMANIPQVSQNATFSVGAGAGEYASEAGIAVGFSARINHNWVTKATIAGTTSNDPVIGAGFSAEW